MRTSQENDKVLPALFAAIEAMPDPIKNAKNQHLKNTYADLGAVLECIEQPLRDNGLVVTRAVSEALHLEIRVWHKESMQWAGMDMPLVMEKNTGHGYGSAITYASRYGLKALFGMHDVDDDGNSASGYDRRQTATAPASNGNGGPPPFRHLDDAEAAILTAATTDELEGVGRRIAASHKLSKDRDTLVSIYEERKHELETQA